jgi:flagellar hook-associated protein 3 FlgL
MRITNKIMQANAIENINKNKELQDKLNTQITTQSKITKPSDDPVIAIRALRLRTNLSEITQYYEKNVPDAEHWLSVTEDSLKSMTEVITDMYEGCVNGSKQYLEAEDRLKIIENMKSLREEVYSTGNASYAGRNIFTGFRTDVSLDFESDQTLPYQITELVNEDSISTFTYVDTDDILDVNQTNFGAVSATEVDIASSEVHRIRLSYDNCGTAVPTITYGTPATTVTATVMSSTGATNPYTEINLPANANAAIFVPETGDLLLGSTLHDTLLGQGQERFQVTYEKEDWLEGDLRPQHYFACTSNPGTANEIIYNPEYMTTSPIDDPSQVITYDVSANQRLRVNTLATECFTHDIGLDIDELVQATESLDLIENKVKMLEDMLEDSSYTTAELADIQEKLDAANKTKILIGDKVQRMFEEGITLMQGYLDQTNLALTNSGNRSSQLELVGNRLQSQQTSFKELASDNEGADVTKLAIELSSAETSYDAALMATSKIIKNSLVEFI